MLQHGEIGIKHTTVLMLEAVSAASFFEHEVMYF